MAIRKQAKGSGTMILLRLKNETPGAVRYEEINKQGQVLGDDDAGAKMATAYFRKAGMFPDGKYPKTLTMIVHEGNLTA